MQITIDIETIPSQKLGARERIRASLKPPGTLKKPESIAAWWANESEAAVEDGYRKQSLDGGLAGEVISIAIAANDDDVGWVFCRTTDQPEALVLAEFVQAVEQRLKATQDSDSPHFAWTNEPFFIAHNASFDLGYLWRRCIINSIALTFKLPSPSARAGKDYGDTMLAWAGFGGRVSLDALCRALGVPSPKDDGIDGSKVFDAWLAGEHERIAAYNLRDTLATREVWHRLQGGGQ
jgi:hypothetical protein